MHKDFSAIFKIVKSVMNYKTEEQLTQEFYKNIGIEAKWLINKTEEDKYGVMQHRLTCQLGDKKFRLYKDTKFVFKTTYSYEECADIIDKFTTKHQDEKMMKEVVTDSINYVSISGEPPIKRKNKV